MKHRIIPGYRKEKVSFATYFFLHFLQIFLSFSETGVQNFAPLVHGAEEVSSSDDDTVPNSEVKKYNSNPSVHPQHEEKEAEEKVQTSWMKEPPRKLIFDTYINEFVRHF